MWHSWEVPCGSERLLSSLWTFWQASAALMANRITTCITRFWTARIMGHHRTATELRGSRHPFLWPETETMPRLSLMLDGDPPANPPQLPTTLTGLRNYLKCAQVLREQGLSLNAEAIGDFGSGFSGPGNVAIGYSPCLTKSRSEQNGYYCFSKRRFLTLSEYFRLQGIPPGRLSLPVGVTEAAARSMVGNSFTVSVVAKLIDRMLYSISLTHHPVTCAPGSGSCGGLTKSQAMSVDAESGPDHLINSLI